MMLLILWIVLIGRPSFLVYC